MELSFLIAIDAEWINRDHPLAPDRRGGGDMIAAWAALLAVILKMAFSLWCIHMGIISRDRKELALWVIALAVLVS